MVEGEEPASNFAMEKLSDDVEKPKQHPATTTVPFPSASLAPITSSGYLSASETLATPPPILPPSSPSDPLLPNAPSSTMPSSWSKVPRGAALICHPRGYAASVLSLLGVKDVPITDVIVCS